MYEPTTTENLRPATAVIAHVIETVQGWTPADQLLALHMLAMTTSHLGGDIMEIGSWCGRSTAVLGHAVNNSGVGHVWAIDLFPKSQDWTTNSDGSHSFTVELDGAETIGGYQDQTVWDEPFQRDIVTVYQRDKSLLDIFCSNMKAEKLDSVVTPFRGTGKMFAEHSSNLRIRLAFLDGDHSYEAVCQDIDAAEQFLIPGGWIAFDDAFSVYDGVDAAIRERIISSDRYESSHQISRKCFAARLK